MELIKPSEFGRIYTLFQILRRESRAVRGARTARPGLDGARPGVTFSVPRRNGNYFQSRMAETPAHVIGMKNTSTL